MINLMFHNKNPKNNFLTVTVFKIRNRLQCKNVSKIWEALDFF